MNISASVGAKNPNSYQFLDVDAIKVVMELMRKDNQEILVSTLLIKVIPISSILFRLRRLAIQIRRPPIVGLELGVRGNLPSEISPPRFVHRNISLPRLFDDYFVGALFGLFDRCVSFVVDQEMSF
jgi:hypothetical protein